MYKDDDEDDTYYNDLNDLTEEYTYNPTIPDKNY